MAVEFRRVESDNAPRATQCPKCGTWLAFHEETSTSPEYRGQQLTIVERILITGIDVYFLAGVVLAFAVFLLWELYK